MRPKHNIAITGAGNLGITITKGIAKLNEMEHQGLSSAVIKSLLAGINKINTITK